VSRVESAYVDPQQAQAAYEAAEAKRAARAATLAAQGKDPKFGDGTMDAASGSGPSMGGGMEVLSEA
jgi:hypothetical protein